MDRKMLRVQGRVCSGRALASQHLAQHGEQLSDLLGETPQPGSLNVALACPLKLSAVNGVWLGKDEHRMIWRATLNGKGVLLYRWQGCPLSVIEVVSATHLRNEFHLKDGSSVVLKIFDDDVDEIGVRAWLGWVLLWKWRSQLYYRSNYGSWIVSLQGYFNGNIGGVVLIKNWFEKASDMIKRNMRQLFFWRRKEQNYSFTRKIPGAGSEGEIDRLMNLLTYTKSSGSAYSADQYPAGYHTLVLDDRVLAGQRQPSARLDLLPISLEGLAVLDIGCNQGGMLLEAARRGIRWGVGIDYDSRMVNAANKVRQYREASNLDFFVFNLEKEQLPLVYDFLPDERVDVIFLLSVCMWIENWRDVIVFFSKMAPNMLFESNGSDEQQDAQAKCLTENFRAVSVLQLASEDDEKQKKRKLYFCTQ